MISQQPHLDFRREALAQYGRARAEGRVLRLAPGWTDSAFHVLLAFLVAAVLWAALGTINEYATGPALVRVAGRQPLTANVSGTASQIHARAGQSVEQGAPLVTLYAESERALLERVSREFDLQLVKLLRDPSDQAARDALAALNAERDLARNQLEQRTLRAPRAGIVSDLRVRIGQHVAAGDVVLSLTDSSAACVVVALLPGHYRPQLAPGMPLRLELDGYRYVYRQLTVDAVTQELIGPAEIGRYIGTDTVPVAGPTLLLSARLPGHTFAAKGREYDYYDGMRATARVRVQGESLLVTLLPALRALSELGRAR